MYTYLSIYLSLSLYLSIYLSISLSLYIYIYIRTHRFPRHFSPGRGKPAAADRTRRILKLALALA